MPDLVSSGARVVRKTRRPSREGLLAFFGNQLGANAVAWTAGVLAAGLVEAFFEQRGLRNLWGLAAWGGRTVVSADDYRVITTLASYTTGLVMLILMRQLVLRWVSEFRALRVERGERMAEEQTERPAELTRRSSVRAPRAGRRRGSPS